LVGYRVADSSAAGFSNPDRRFHIDSAHPQEQIVLNARLAESVRTSSWTIVSGASALLVLFLLAARPLAAQEMPGVSDGRHPCDARESASRRAEGDTIPCGPSKHVAFAWNALAMTAASSAMLADGDTLKACYVPTSGTVYRVGVPGLPAGCFAATHVLFMWNAAGATGPQGPQGDAGPV
jgi:hypothetical protein